MKDDDLENFVNDISFDEDEHDENEDNDNSVNKDQSESNSVSADEEEVIERKTVVQYTLLLI